MLTTHPQKAVMMNYVIQNILDHEQTSKQNIKTKDGVLVLF